MTVYNSINGRWSDMEKCGICGGDVPKQPSITKDGKCDACHKKLEVKEEHKK
jgi:hypothetical protein